MSEISNNKPTLAVFSLRSCKGCQEQILNADTILPELAGQVDFVYWEKLMEAEIPEHVDIAVVEGACVSPEDEGFLHRIREISDKVIAIGLCACGMNWMDDVREYKPLHAFIDVDYKVRCCPIDTRDFIATVQHAIYGHNTFESTASLCGACKMNEVECILDYGRLCAGLITQTGCFAICTKLGATCYGCGGISINAQVDTARHVFGNTAKNSSLDEFLEACNVDRLLNQQIDSLDIDKSSFVVSRKCGRHSHRNVIAHLREYEKTNEIEVDEKIERVRDCLVKISNARNYLSDLFFDTLRVASSYNSFFDFYNSNVSFVQEFLETRLILNSALTEISGRSIHPITLKPGGFALRLDRSALLEVSRDLETVVDFAIRTVDFANSLWEETELSITTPVLDEVMQIWDDMYEEARFAAAKAGLRPPEHDSRRECVAKAVAALNCIKGALFDLSFVA